MFGPQPDDIEIGLGGTVAARGAWRPRRPVRSHGGGDGEQRHGRGAAGRSRSGARGARRGVARQPALAGPRASAGTRSRRARRQHSSGGRGRGPWPCRMVGSSPGSRGGQSGPDRGRVQHRAAPLRRGPAMPGSPSGSATTSSTTPRAVVRDRRLRPLRHKRRALDCHEPVRAPAPAAWPRD